jgi:hypothetical protein
MKVADSNLHTFVEGFYSSWHWSCKTHTLHDAKLRRKLCFIKGQNWRYVKPGCLVITEFVCIFLLSI